MSKETYAEQLARVREISYGATWNLPLGDAEALTAVLARLDALEKPVTAEDVRFGKHSPGCDVEAVRSDPNLPRRFRWHSLGHRLYGAYLPIGHCYVTATTCKGGKPDWPVEWIDPEPEAT